jgi:tryptophan-rich sensory protein
MAAAFTACAVGALFTATSVGTWYQTLRKPAWNPPGWVFGPVWTGGRACFGRPTCSG